jgi:beta-lactamase superfamily II metal-dependent hydrolase
MFPTDHELLFTFYDVGGGDAIHIRFLGNDQKWHNILLDGGYGKTYKDVFGPLIRSLPSDECIDLWIISHTDLDHIGAVLGFTQDKKIKYKRKAVQQFWFNYSPLTVKVGNGKLGVSQGVKLRDYLKTYDLLVKEDITTNSSVTDLFGLNISILSPTPEKLKIAQDSWQEIERKGKLGRSVEKADHKQTIGELIRPNFEEDKDEWNGGSIACKFELKGIQALLLADSHPSVICDSLEHTGITENDPLTPQFMQLAHHGSKANTCSDILKLVKTGTYVVTGNGVTNRHPDKETIVRVLMQQKRKTDSLEFLFPGETDELKSFFEPDQDAFAEHHFSFVYPEPGAKHISRKFLCIKKDLE